MRIPRGSCKTEAVGFEAEDEALGFEAEAVGFEAEAAENVPRGCLRRGSASRQHITSIIVNKIH